MMLITVFILFVVGGHCEAHGIYHTEGLNEVEFDKIIGGVAKATSEYDADVPAIRGFMGPGYTWHSAAGTKLPQSIWYEFPHSLTVVKFSFQSRTDHRDECKGIVRAGPSKYKFWGSNAIDCSSTDGRVTLYEDDSGTPFTTQNIPKVMQVPNHSSYRCYGFTVTDTAEDRTFASLSNIRFWYNDEVQRWSNPTLGCIKYQHKKTLFTKYFEECKDACENEIKFVCRSIEYTGNNKCELSTEISTHPSYMEPCYDPYGDALYAEIIKGDDAEDDAGDEVGNSKESAIAGDDAEDDAGDEGGNSKESAIAGDDAEEDARDTDYHNTRAYAGDEGGNSTGAAYAGDDGVDEARDTEDHNTRAYAGNEGGNSTGAAYAGDDGDDEARDTEDHNTRTYAGDEGVSGAIAISGTGSISMDEALGNTECSSPWILVDNECFLVVSDKRQWADARQYCIDQGADLAQPKDFNAIINYLNNKHDTLQRFWLGGSDLGGKGNWRWLNGGEIVSGWYPGEPNNKGIENCLEVVPKHGTAEYLNDQRCEYSTYSLCQK